MPDDDDGSATTRTSEGEERIIVIICDNSRLHMFFAQIVFMSLFMNVHVVFISLCLLMCPGERDREPGRGCRDWRGEEGQP